MRSRYLVAVVVLSGALHFDEVGATLTTNSWTATSGKWETAGNWSAGAPTITQPANLITNATTKVVTIDALTPAGTLTISNLVISGPAGTVNTLQLTNAPSSTLQILGSLSMANGGVLTISNSAVQAESSFLDGDVFLQSGSLVVTNFVTWISEYGGGSLTISNGAAQFGEVYLGLLDGAGTLTVAGGTNQLLSAFNIGIQMEVIGAVWVTGGQLVVTNGSTSLGGAGYGQMTVSNGAALLNDLSIGNYPGAAGTLTVAGGTAQLYSFLSVGSVPGATGSVELTGGQLTVTNDYARVGDTGVGQMTISNGTWLANYEYVGYQTGSEGTLTIAGGTNIISALFEIGTLMNGTGTVWLTGGQLIASYGAMLSDGGIGQMIISNGTFVTGGLFFGDPNFASGTLTVAGGTATIGELDLDDGTQTVWVTGGQLNVTNGTTTIGYYTSGVAHMTVSNGLWRAHDVTMGVVPGSQGTLTVAGGVSSVYSNVTIGNTNCSAAGFVFVTGGELHVTNDDATAVLEVRDGTLIQTGGLLDIDRLVITNPCAHFMHLGGTLIIGLETLSPDLDADGDGIPNGYELANGLDPLDPTDANEDNDGDGMSNLQEYLAGTDPNNSASYFHIRSVARTGNDLRVTWMMGPGKTNALQWTAGPVNGSYNTNGFADLFIVTNTVGTVTNHLDVGGATNVPARYYRVRLVP